MTEILVKLEWVPECTGFEKNVPSNPSLLYCKDLVSKTVQNQCKQTSVNKRVNKNCAMNS